MEVLMHHFAFGKPRDVVAFADGDKLSVEEFRLAAEDYGDDDDDAPTPPPKLARTRAKTKKKKKLGLVSAR